MGLTNRDGCDAAITRRPRISIGHQREDNAPLKARNVLLNSSIKP